MKLLVQVLILFLNFLNIGFCSLLFSPPTTNNSVCSPWETAALLQIKKSKAFDVAVCSLCDEAHDKTESWKEGTDCCIWEGVTCDGINGHVIGLDLSYSCISGDAIFSKNSLFSLLHLQSLNLAFNAFYSDFSLMFGQVTSLTYLNLSGSHFEGKLPSQISHLKKLLSLDLSDNHELEIEANALKGMVENLTEIKQLFLDFSDMSSIDPSIFTNLSSSLTHLSLTYTFLRGKFHENIFRLPNLIMLNLESTSGLTPQLPKSNWSGPLDTLILSVTRFDDKFPPSIVNLSSLRYLDMSSCSCLGSLPVELGNLNIIHLDLSHNQISGVIPSSFTNLTQLRYLDFSDNQLSGHLTEFPRASLLEYIHMENNRLQGPIPSSVSHLLNLGEFDMSSNNLSGIVDLHWFSKLQRLGHFVLSHNALSLVFDVTVSYKFPFLSFLKLSSCNISQVPTLVLGESNSTLEFDFSNNKIQDIPKWVWDVGNFRYLNLSYNILKNFEQPPSVTIATLALSFNSIQGPLLIPPPTFYFSISNNGLTGEIPSTICGRDQLLFLDMSHNNLSGVIPPCMGKVMSSLVILNLRQNKLQGTIPSPTIRCSLLYLSLSNNQIRGQIPNTFANCSDLEVLDLSNNNLHGEFPYMLRTLESLQVLVLRSNKLYDFLEDSDTNVNFHRLKVLDVLDNHLYGPLATTFIKSLRAMVNSSEGQYDGQYVDFDHFYGVEVYYGYSIVLTEKGSTLELQKILNVLVSIDFSNNKFDGEIPYVVGELNSLIGLNLSHNNLSGQIPRSVGNLTILEWLDLSSNRLAGKIPGELENLKWLSTLNLSNNHLVGPIPQGKQFNTFANERI